MAVFARQNQAACLDGFDFSLERLVNMPPMHLYRLSRSYPAHDASIIDAMVVHRICHKPDMVSNPKRAWKEVPVCFKYI